MQQQHTQMYCVIPINMKGRENFTLKMKPHNTHTDIDSAKSFAFTWAVKLHCLKTVRPLQDEAS